LTPGAGLFEVAAAAHRWACSGHPVLVGCTYDPNNKMLKKGQLDPGADGGHSVLIVGCNDAKTEFLYVDPFAGASYMRYTGGIAADSYPLA
jgi:hypothetical protein